MQQTFTIRQATPDDARDIAEVHVATWRDAYDGVMPDDVLADLSVDDRESMWTDNIDSNDDEPTETWVAEQDGDIVGFCSFGPVRGEDDGDENASDTSTAELYAIYVDPSAQRNCLGHSLMATAETRMDALDHESAVLWVLEDNGGAREFYETCGWESDGQTETGEYGGSALDKVRYDRTLST